LLTPVSAIPVGFAGLNNHLNQQASTRVEDSQQIVGPDGHVEELPPYTRYPESGASGATSRSRPAQNAEEATLSPLESPTVPNSLDQSQTQLSTHSVVSDSSRQELHHAANPSNQNSTTEKPQSTTLGKRFWGGKLPLWGLVVILLLLALIISMIITGSVIGMKKKERHKELQRQPFERSE
jgi:hypothetical protein